MNEHTKVILVGNSPEAPSIKARLVAMGLDEKKVTIQVNHTPYVGGEESVGMVDSTPPAPARATFELSKSVQRAERFARAYGGSAHDLEREFGEQMVTNYPEVFYDFPKKHRGKKRGHNPGAFGKSRK